MTKNMILALALAAPIALAGDRDERMSFGYSYVDDGGCAKAAQVFTGSYLREREKLDVLGNVQVAPSGGNCERDAVNYNFSIERYLDLPGVWDAFGKFGADKRSTSSLYALMDPDGSILQRDDGGPLFATRLPSGVAETIIAAFGVSRDFGLVRAGLGMNIVPIDWSDGKGRSIHGDIGLDLNGLDMDMGIDIGKGFLGEARATYHWALNDRFGIAAYAEYVWGLNELDDGAPGVQNIADAPFTKIGAPRNDAWGFGAELSFTP